jgi:toxin YoeB
MVRKTRKIIWTKKAIQSRKSIFLYWNARNKSDVYSNKLNVLFAEAIQQVSQFPESSISSQLEFIRLKVVRDYQIIYQITDTEIIVHYIWDTRQNPQNFPVK